MTPEIEKMFEKCEYDYKMAHTPTNYNYGTGRTYTYQNGQLIPLDNSTKRALAKAVKVLNKL